MTKSTIQIPGMFLARVENGRIVGYVFSPAASHAGHFGESFSVFDGETIEEDDFWAMVNQSLMFSEDNRTATFSCEWSE